MMQRTILFTAVLTAATLGWASLAQAAGDIEIGGKKSLTAVVSVVTSEPDEGDDSTTLLIGGTGAYTTQNGRFEIGAGLTIIGLFASDDFAIYSPRIEGRVNSNLLGPEENVLVYVGAVAGAGFIRSDFFDDEVGVFGPKAGAEFYVSPNMAIQLEDQLTFDTEGGLQNNLTVGFKLLFN